MPSFFKRFNEITIFEQYSRKDKKIKAYGKNK